MTCGHGQSGVTATFDANFGQRPFTIHHQQDIEL